MIIWSIYKEVPVKGGILIRLNWIWKQYFISSSECIAYQYELFQFETAYTVYYINVTLSEKNQNKKYNATFYIMIYCSRILKDIPRDYKLLQLASLFYIKFVSII